MKDLIEKIVKELSKMETVDRIEAINSLKIALKEVSPFSKEPVDCVVWVKGEKVFANDYNPNSVAPPEMLLLKTSIEQDGYTQPLVAWDRGEDYEVVDGFHRNRVGKECKEIQDRIHGYLPLSVINNERSEVGDRMASTIRHNRARGKHAVDSMTDIVVELKKRNWNDEKISKNLGMDKDEITRLSQISGLTEMFIDKEFSDSWDIGYDESPIEELEV